MIMNRRFMGYIFLTALLLLFLPKPLWAQNSNEDYTVSLSWIGDNYTLQYEVIIERNENGDYLEILRNLTDTASIEIHLAQGSYRCKVIPYDILKKPGTGSEWTSFEIRTPVIPSVSEPENEEVAEIEFQSEEEPYFVYRISRRDLFISPKTEKLFSIYIGASWMPVVPIYGQNGLFLGKHLSLLGAGIRIGVLYTNMKYIDMGPELTGSWYAINDGVQHHSATAGLNLAVRMILPNEAMALSFRFGGGVTIPAGSIYFNLNLGASFIWYALEHFYLEAGMDYTHIFTRALPQAGALRPSLGIGWCF